MVEIRPSFPNSWETGLCEAQAPRRRSPGRPPPRLLGQAPHRPCQEASPESRTSPPSPSLNLFKKVLIPKDLLTRVSLGSHLSSAYPVPMRYSKPRSNSAPRFSPFPHRATPKPSPTPRKPPFMNWPRHKLLSALLAWNTFMVGAEGARSTLLPRPAFQSSGTSTLGLSGHSFF